MQRVLIVDDVPDNRLVLADALEGEGYVLDEAVDGVQALEQVALEQPDIVLLDIMMPRMDGLTCCRALRGDEKMRHMPVLLITALVEEDKVVEGLDAGATDYIPKPFSYPVIRARVRAALRGKLAHDHLETRNREILQLAYAMTHDLQTPLASMIGAVEALAQRWAGGAGERADAGPGWRSEVEKWLSRLRRAADRMVEMLNDLMAYARAGNEQLELVALPLLQQVRAAVEELREQADRAAVRVEMEVDDCAVIADVKALPRVLANLIGNAIKYIDRPAGGRVTIRARRRQSIVRLSVRDNGPGIAPAQLEQVFMPFKRATASKPGTGLGLSIVKKYVEAMGGKVSLQSDGCSGTTAVVDLPAARVSDRRRQGTPAAAVVAETE